MECLPLTRVCVSRTCEQLCDKNERLRKRAQACLCSPALTVVVMSIVMRACLGFANGGITEGKALKETGLGQGPFGMWNCAEVKETLWGSFPVLPLTPLGHISLGRVCVCGGWGGVHYNSQHLELARSE